MDFKELKTELVKVIAKFKKEKMATVKTSDGKTLHYEGDTLDVGVAVHTEGEAGMAPASDGDYKLDDGTLIVVKEGKVIEVKKPEEQAAAREVAVDYDKLAQAVMSAIAKEIADVKADFSKQITALKTALEAKEKETKELKESFEKEAKFSKEVMAILEKLPSEHSQKPNTKAHQPDVDPIQEFKRKYLNQ